MADRIGVRSFLVGEGDVHVETLILQGFVERARYSAEWNTRDAIVLPLLPREVFPDEESRAAYFAYMEDQLRGRLEESIGE